MRHSRLALVLAAVAYIGVLAYLYRFSQTRYFTVDEYQYASATNMVAQGLRPYVDFYEHHPPLSYTLHAPLLSLAKGEPFRARVLLFRKVVFAYLSALSLLIVWHARRRTGELSFGLLTATLALSVGFGAMSAVDYRADGFAAVLLLASLLLLDDARDRQGPALAVVSGMLAGGALFMTQKVVYLGGVTFGLLFLTAIDERYLQPKPYVRGARLVSWTLGFLLVSSAAFALLAATGLLPDMLRIVVSDAFRHEALYPAVHFSKYMRGYLGAHPTSSLLLGLLAVYYLLDRGERVWVIASFGWLATVLATKAQYPYNFVYPSLVTGLCAARGLHALCARLTALWPARDAGLRVAAVALGLALAAAQLSYTLTAPDNRHQLALYDKLEAFASPDDRLVDNAGAGIYLRPASYYYLHGTAHRKMFRDYFETRLVEDWRSSGARFLIRDFRLEGLPALVERWLSERFVRVDGDLYARALRLPAVTGSETASVDIELEHAGWFHLFAESALLEVRGGAPPPAQRPPGAGRPYHASVAIDGRPATAARVQLSAGTHRFTVSGGRQGRGYASSVPLAAYRPTIPAGRHTMLFPY